MKTQRVLVVESDAVVREWLADGFADAGFDVDAVGDAAGARAGIRKAPDAMVIALDLGDADGLEVARGLRAQGAAAPALFLVCGGASANSVRRSGDGDDHIVAPFAVDEVVGRVRRLVRGAGAAAPTVTGSVRIDRAMHALIGERGAVSLTPTELRVFAALARRRGVVVRRRDLIRAAWPREAVVYDNTLDQYIRRLRAKLTTVTRQSAIVTTRGEGYRLHDARDTTADLIRNGVPRRRQERG